ncbi:hypothetical protein [Janibacter alittae]|uniref:Uncharacterized protein n=1 Tax=Janibacter alittae TaxID=3115209 RepID=A0ABZ2MKR3_9MICO
MAKIRCDGVGEFTTFPEAEFRVFGGVLVHAVGAWHLTSGDVIEMVGHGKPLLHDGRPVVQLGGWAPPPSDPHVIGEFDTAYRRGVDDV